jgi:hypothetical protein
VRINNYHSTHCDLGILYFQERKAFTLIRVEIFFTEESHLIKPSLEGFNNAKEIFLEYFKNKQLTVNEHKALKFEFWTTDILFRCPIRFKEEVQEKILQAIWFVDNENYPVKIMRR